MECDKYLKEISEANKRINDLSCKGEYLRTCLEDQGKKTTDLLDYIENRIDIMFELYRREHIIGREIIAVKHSDDTVMIYDFQTGKRIEAPCMTMKEYEEYVNRRAGFKIYGL